MQMTTYFCVSVKNMFLFSKNTIKLNNNEMSQNYIRFKMAENEEKKLVSRKIKCKGHFYNITLILVFVYANPVNNCSLYETFQH